MDTYALLERAIAEREQVTATYNGLARAFCPHALGLKGEVRHVLAFQFAGASKRGLPPGGDWRCFDIARLTNVATRPGPWHTDANLFNPQSCIDTIEALVQPLPSAKGR
jgi:hypothetical protein